MIGVREIDHLVLRVSDVAAMVAFYRDVLDCPSNGGRTTSA